MIAFIILLIVNLVILSRVREPQALTEVKEKYKIIANAGEKNINDFDVKEIIPRIFCVEKN